MAESVRVIVRCRPMNEREKGLKCNDVLKINGDIAQCSISNPAEKSAPPKSFTFDGAYNENSTTEQIYTDIGYPLVEGVTEGYNGTIFAYGQTGSGKSFSMQGLVQPDCQRGIIPRAFEHIFETIQITQGSKFLVHASYVEIYNEEVRDLLGKDIKRKLDLKEHPERGVYIQDLSKHICKNVADCGRVMEKGWKNRSTGSTLMNADSSRSHSIFTIHLERCETDPKGEDRIRGAKLNLVDLAGSERQSKTGATGDRLKEATKINLSLSALGNVISALVDGKATHIPYRDSKLTRLLQDSLGGNTKTLMVACLSPADNNYEETLSTLRYANRAKNIKNKPKINEDPKDAMIREYQDEIKRLKAMLRGELPVQLDGGSNQPLRTNNVKGKDINQIDIEAEKERIRKEYEKELKKARDELKAMKLSKDEIDLELSRLREFYENKLQTVEQDDKLKIYSGERKNIEENKTDLENNENINRTIDDDSDDSLAVVTNNNKRSGQDKIFYINPAKKNANGKSNGRSKVQSKRYPNSGGNNQEDLNSEDFTSDDHNLEDLNDEDMDVTSMSQNTTKSLVSETSATTVLVNQSEAMKRMKELEQKFQLVGGEHSGNKELLEKRQKRMKYAEERYKKLREAMALEGEDILVNIYENINDDLKGTRRKLLSEQNKVSMLERDIKDLQCEFESERRDYLNTIREQEKDMKYLQAIIERIHPTLRRDCNYSSLIRIKNMAKWDENSNQWNLPPMTIEKTQLPTPGVYSADRLNNRNEPMPYNGSANYHDNLDREDSLQQKLKASNDSDATAGFVGSRARQIVQNQSDMRGMARNGLGSHSASASVLYSREASSPSPLWSNGGANPSPSEMDKVEVPPGPKSSRRPIRLQALEPLTLNKENKKLARRPPL